MKLSKELLDIIIESNETEDSSVTNKLDSYIADTLNEHLESIGIEGVRVTHVQEFEEELLTIVTFTDDEFDLMAVFFQDDDGDYVVTVVEDIDELSDADEVEAIPLPEVPVKEDGLIDFSNPDFLDEEIVYSILTFDEEEEDGSIDERSIVVIRGGKRVRKKLKRKKRKKRLSAKRKLSIRKGVRKRRLKRAQIARKRKKSLKIRNRAKLKNKPPKTKLAT
jgi:hypothetical protein